jgi:hypothetical protein
VPGNQIGFDLAASHEFPTSIALDLELVDVRRLVIFDPNGATPARSRGPPSAPSRSPQRRCTSLTPPVLLGNDFSLFAGAARFSARRTG